MLDTCAEVNAAECRNGVLPFHAFSRFCSINCYACSFVGRFKSRPNGRPKPG
jgi:hypothetical protein